MTGIRPSEEMDLSLDESSWPQDAPVKYGRKIEIPDEELQRPIPPPTSTARRGRRGILIIAVIVVVSLIVGSLVYLLAIPSDENTPEEAFQAMIDALNDADSEALMRCTVVCFAEGATSEAELALVDAMFEVQGIQSMVVHSYQVVTPDDSAYLQQTLNSLAEFTEAMFSVTVDDVCAIVASYTIYYEDHSYSADEVPFPFVKVGSRWYLAFAPFT